MNLQEIKALIAEFKETKAKGAITPATLGSLLENIVAALESPITRTVELTVNVFEDKLKFVDDDNWSIIHDNLGHLEMFNIYVAVCYSSGLKNRYAATCVKPNYISLNAKAGSCELHVLETGKFTVDGKELW